MCSVRQCEQGWPPEPAHGSSAAVCTPGFADNARIVLHHLLAHLRKACLALLVLGAGSVPAQDRTLRLLTRPLYVPDDVAETFTRETGIRLLVTEVEDDALLPRLLANPAAFDLAQPSQDRIALAQTAHGLFKPLDLSRLRSGRYLPAMLSAVRLNTAVGGEVYGVPHLWGTDGLAVDTRLGRTVDLKTLCASTTSKIGARATRSTLVTVALAGGLDPFAAYADPVTYGALMDRVALQLRACSPQLQWVDDTDQLLAGLRRRELVAAAMSDGPTWRLARWLPELRYPVPPTGVAGWIASFALPAQGRQDEAAYAWINFNLRPDIAARVATSAGQFSAVRGAEQAMDPALRRQFAQSFDEAALRRIRWYPPLPPEIEAIDLRVLQRLRTAR